MLIGHSAIKLRGATIARLEIERNIKKIKEEILKLKEMKKRGIA